MSNKIYTTIPAPKVPRNTFNRSRPNTLTMPFQRNVPVLAEEIYPGDLMRCNPEVFSRLQPLVAPVMNNMKISTHFFFVPLRTLNKHFSEFMFNNRTGDYTDVLPYCYTGTLYYLVEQVSSPDAGGNDKLAAEIIRFLDYIGLPFKYSSKTTAAAFVGDWLADEWNMAVAGGTTLSPPDYNTGCRINLAPFFCYQKIWSEYFRDENVEEDPFVQFEEDCNQDVFDWTGDKSGTLYTLIAGGLYEEVAQLFCLRRRAWAHDRFTSALPFAQRGPDVLLPISGTAPVVYNGKMVGPDDEGMNIVSVQGTNQVYSGALRAAAANGPGFGGLSQQVASGDTTTSSNRAALDPNGLLDVDFDSASLATTINDFRIAERVQRWFENDARGGVRPNEGTLAHFGIRTPDSTLDRAEFIGGSMQPIVVSEVAQTSQSTESSPQGTLAGKGTSYKSNRGFKMFFTEHGFVFGICSALVRANYWQGIPKMFSRMQRDEYYWPEFANLGEEPVFTKELYADANNVSEDDVFGYVPRYSDLKSAVGEVHGDMRSSMSFWTQVREFANKPALNREFLFGDPDLSPFAVQSYYSDPIIVTIQFHLKASRLMPFYGVPTL